MKAIEMKTGIVYKALTGSTDGTIEIGQIMWVSPKDLSLCLPDSVGGGALNKEEWMSAETCDFEVEITSEYYVDINRGSECLQKKD
jgi:hypothetical protein